MRPSLVGIKAMPKGGFEPPLSENSTVHEGDIFITQSIQNPTLVETLPAMSIQKNTISIRPQDIFLHGEYGICMGDLPEDLRKVIEAWDSLPKAVKAGILAMVKAARQA
jgi:hypothetical protein